MNSNVKDNDSSILKDYNLTNEDLETIKNFNLKIISNTKELEPEYSKVVDDHFWDLI